MNFETDEALLTGESLPVAKDSEASWAVEGEKGDWDPRDVGVGGKSSCSLEQLSLLSKSDFVFPDRINMAFTSSTVTKGRAKGIVVAIGMEVSPSLFPLLSPSPNSLKTTDRNRCHCQISRRGRNQNPARKT